MRAWFLVVLVACNTPRIYMLDELPVEEWTGGLPVRGDGVLVTDYVPGYDGFAEFRCNHCTLGNDRTRLDLGDNYFDGAEFGHILFDSVVASVTFENNAMHFESEWRSQEVTLDAVIDGVFTHDRELSLDGCIRFALHDALLSRDAKMHSLLSITGAPRDDGGRYTIKIGGTLDAMKRLGQICAPAE
jgi:hypothetical protein